MKIDLTQEDKQATKDAINRFQRNDAQLHKDYEVEFVITNGNSATLNSFKDFLNQSNINYKNIEFNNADLILTINMKLNYDKIVEIESYLTFFANENGLKYDGWGAFE